MEGLFLQILNMSISASWMILAVMVLRIILKNAPKDLRYILWAFVAIRLIMPLALESDLSLIPSEETFSEEFLYEEVPQLSSGIDVVDDAVNDMLVQQVEQENDVFLSGASDNTSNDILDEQISTNIGNPENNGGNSMADGDANMGTNEDAYNDPNIGNSGFLTQEENMGANRNESDGSGVCGTTETGKTLIQSVLSVASRLWLVGIVVMVLYTMYIYLKLRKSVQVSIRLRDNLWIGDAISSPFIFGFVNPRIYLPSHISEAQIPYIEAHEKEHLRYRDHWWKPFGFAILTIHWFNPFVWMAYVLMCRDIELACDERVIRLMNTIEKKNYTESLLLCSSPRHLISACPVAFGEIGIKERIKNVVQYKKPTGTICGVAAVLCVIVAICFLSNPTEKITFEKWTSSITPEDIYWVEVSKNYNKETVSWRIPKKAYQELCDVFATIHNEDCTIGKEIGEGLDTYELMLSREDKVWQFFCYEDKTVGLLFEDYKTGSAYGCEGGILVIDSPELWQYIRNAVDSNGEMEYTPADAVDDIFSNLYAVLKMKGTEAENACIVARDHKITRYLPSYFYKYKWERIEKPEISSDTHWVSISTKDETYRLVVWDVEDALLECTAVDDNGKDMITFYWKGVKKENTSAESTLFSNVWKLSESVCMESGYNKYYDGEKLVRLAALVGMEELFADYDGEEICHYYIDNALGTMTRDDLVYYCTDETDLQTIVQKMFSVMMDALMEPSENRTYMVTQYRMREMEIIQGSDNVWFIPYVQGAYKYEGVDLLPFEDMAASTIVYEDGLIPFFGQGSDGQFYYILIKHGDVYRLERGNIFTAKYGYLWDYIEEMEAAQYTETVLYETEGDFTHDGIMDKLQFVFYKSNSSGYASDPAAVLRDKNNFVRIKVYKGTIYGISDVLPYTSDKFSVAECKDQTIGWTRVDGKDYLFFAHMKDADGQADYSYSLYSINDGKLVEAKSNAWISSKNDYYKYLWAENGQSFQLDFNRTMREGTVLVSFKDEIVVSKEDNIVSASEYFQNLWYWENEQVHQWIMKKVDEFQAQKEEDRAIQTEFIDGIDKQVAEYFNERETLYVRPDTRTAWGRAIQNSQEIRHEDILRAEIGYVYKDMYQVSETKRLMLIQEVGFTQVSTRYTETDGIATRGIGTEHLFTFELQNGRWKLVDDAYMQGLDCCYQQGLDMETWQVYFTLVDDTNDEILQALEEMEMSVWFENYNGETIQCIRGEEALAPAKREDIVFYRTNETDVQVILKRMIEEMMEPLMEESEERPYTIIKYRIDKNEVYQFSENIWYITYLNGYYKYDGMDMVDFEGRLAYETPDRDGLISFDRQGGEGTASYVLLKQGNVYCLRATDTLRE